MTSGQQPEEHEREVVRVRSASQTPVPARPADDDPLLDRVTKFWLWILGLAVIVAIAAVVVGIVIGGPL